MPKKKDIYLIRNEAVVTVTVENNRVTKYDGDEAIIDIVKPMFETPLLTIGGEESKGEDGVNRNITYDIVLEPGDKEFIQAVMLERIFPAEISVATDVSAN